MLKQLLFKSFHGNSKKYFTAKGNNDQNNNKA